MSETQIINHMIEFIEEKEKDLLASKLQSDSKNKGDIVNAIINELERVLNDENQDN